MLWVMFSVLARHTQLVVMCGPAADVVCVCLCVRCNTFNTNNRFTTFGKEGVIDVNGPAEVTPTPGGERIKATFTEAELKWNGIRWGGGGGRGEVRERKAGGSCGCVRGLGVAIGGGVAVATGCGR